MMDKHTDKITKRKVQDRPRWKYRETEETQDGRKDRTDVIDNRRISAQIGGWVGWNESGYLGVLEMDKCHGWKRLTVKEVNTKTNRQKDGIMGEGMGGYKVRLRERSIQGFMGGWVGGLVDGWMEGRTDCRQIDRQTDRQRDTEAIIMETQRKIWRLCALCNLRIICIVLLALEGIPTRTAYWAIYLRISSKLLSMW